MKKQPRKKKARNLYNANTLSILIYMLGKIKLQIFRQDKFTLLCNPEDAVNKRVPPDEISLTIVEKGGEGDIAQILINVRNPCSYVTPVTLNVAFGNGVDTPAVDTFMDYFKTSGFTINVKSDRVLTT